MGGRSSESQWSFPTGVIKTVADEGNNAGLQRGGWNHDCQHFARALEAIGHGNQDVVENA